MKILFLAPQPFFVDRGTPIAVRAAVQALASLGYEIDLLTYFGGRDIDLPGVTIHRIERPPLVRHVPIGPSWQKVPCDVAMFGRAREMVRDGDYDYVHAVEEAAILAWLMNREYPQPYIFDMDSRMSHQIVEKSVLLWPLGRLFARLERAAINHSAGVLAVCPALVEYAERFHPTKNVRLLPDLPLPELPGADEKVGEDPCNLRRMRGTKLLYVGNLEPYQGIDLMIKAFRRAARRCDATLAIVGGSEEKIGEYMWKARDLIEAERIYFLGPRPISELRAILDSADILVSPRTRGINTPMKIYNYMTAGKAIVATRRLTHTQVLDDSVAYLTEATPEALSDGMIQLATRPVLRVQLGRAARELVHGEYGSSRFTQRISEFYRTLPRRNGGTRTEPSRGAAVAPPH
jgi:glycosyltransferase involved in cell wall biosynthesis